MRRHPTKFRQFFNWLRRTVDTLCERPDHLQRLSIIGSGVSVYPAVFALVALLVWFATHYPQTLLIVVNGIVNFVYIFLGLFALVIVTMLGSIKGLKFGPRGLELSTTFDDLDVDPGTRRDTRLSGGGGGGPFGGGFGGGGVHYTGDGPPGEEEEEEGEPIDLRGGRPMPQVTVTD